MAQKMNSRHASALGAGVLTLVAALGAGVAVHLQSQSQLEPLRQDSAQVRLSAVHAQLQSQLVVQPGESPQEAVRREKAAKAAAKTTKAAAASASSAFQIWFTW